MNPNEPVTRPETEADPRQEILTRLDQLQDLFVRRLSEDRDKRHLIEDLGDRLRAAEDGVVREYLTPIVVGAARVIDRIDAYAYAENQTANEPGSPGEQHLAFVRSLGSELVSLLEQHGVEQVRVRVDEPFDPHVHEMVHLRGDHSAHGALRVHAVLRRGFQYRSQLLRPAQVVAAVTAPGTEHPLP